MIESYLRTLIDEDLSDSEDELEISPFVKSMKTGINMPTNFDYKKEYGNYLAEKYQ